MLRDFDPESQNDRAVRDALTHSAAALHLDLEVDWLGPDKLETGAALALLEAYHGIFSAGGAHKIAAIEGARFARERGRPFVGT